MNNLVKKFMQYALGNGIALIIGAISSPIISRLISTENFGVFSNYNSLISLVSILSILGFDQAYARFFYEENKESRKALLFNCLKLPIISLSIISVLVVVFYKPITIYLLDVPSLNLAIFLILNTFIMILFSFSSLVIRMKQRGKAYSVIQITIKALYILFTLILYAKLKDSVWTLIIALFTSNMIAVLIAILMEKEEWNFINQKSSSKISRKKLIKYSSPLILSSAMVWIFNYIDRVFLTIYSSMSEVGIYSSAFTIIALLNALQSTFSTFWVPLANEKYINEPNNTEFFMKIYKYTVVGMCTVLILLIVSKDLIIFLLGKDYEQARYIFPFLSLMPVLTTLSEVTVVGINFKKKTKYHIYITALVMVTSVVGNFILTPRLGGKGAAISTGVSFIVYFVLRTYYSRKLYYVDYGLKKFCLLMFAISILALYSTFNKIDSVIIILTVLCLLLEYILYKDIFDEIKLVLIKMLNQIKNRRVKGRGNERK